jgi:predicted Zn-dependent protease
MPRPRRAAPPPATRWRAAALALALALGGCASHTVFNPVTGRSEFSVVSDRALQAQADEAREALVDEHGLYAHDKLVAYVSAIGLKVAAVSHQPALPWRFTVLDSEVVNAFALPGGQVFVTRGLLAHLQNEAELAGVLAHEIAHITARHGAQRASGAAVAERGVLAAINVGQFLESRGVAGAERRLRRLGLGLAQGLIARYSREQELEADRLGAEYLARAGYDARGLLGVLRMLQRLEQAGAEPAPAGPRDEAAPDWLSSHPGTEQRLREAQRQRVPARPEADDGHERYLAAIDGLVWGDSPDKGLVRDRLFVHPRAGYALTAPPGWEIEVDGSAVAMHTPDGDATLTVRLLPRPAGRTHAQVIENLLQPTEGRSTPRRVGAFDGTHFVGSRLRGDQRVPLRATVVSGPGQRLFLVDYTARDAAALQRALAAMQAGEQSFRAATAADRRSARVWRLSVVPLPEGGFAELARGTPLGSEGEATLRLINGANDPGTAPRPGTPVKSLRESVR